MHGFLILDKAIGPSSNQAINGVKRLLPKRQPNVKTSGVKTEGVDTARIKIGHAGTLDPLASGVLVLMLGKCTKLCERVMGQPKQYEATIKLGATTPSDDRETQEIISTFDAIPTEAMVLDVCGKFVGTIQQTPPIYSAMKISGKRACDHVRGGQSVVLQPRPIRIDKIVVTRYAFPFLDITIDCGRGTYVRSLARDIGDELGTGGYLWELRRTRVGAFDIKDSYTIDKLGETGLESALLSPDFLGEPEEKSVEL